MIDSRELIEEREELKEQVFDAFIEDFPQYEEMTDSYDDILFDEEELEGFVELYSEEIDRVKQIDDLEQEIGHSEWVYGLTLIPYDDFTEYVKDLLEDCGNIPRDLPWYIEVDWEKTAENVSADYSQVTFEDEEFLYRS